MFCFADNVIFCSKSFNASMPHQINILPNYMQTYFYKDPQSYFQNLLYLLLRKGLSYMFLATATLLLFLLQKCQSSTPELFLLLPSGLECFPYRYSQIKFSFQFHLLKKCISDFYQKSLAFSTYPILHYSDLVSFTALTSTWNCIIFPLYFILLA